MLRTELGKWLEGSGDMQRKSGEKFQEVSSIVRFGEDMFFTKSPRVRAYVLYMGLRSRLYIEVSCQDFDDGIWDSFKDFV